MLRHFAREISCFFVVCDLIGSIGCSNGSWWLTERNNVAAGSLRKSLSICFYCSRQRRAVTDNSVGRHRAHNKKLVFSLTNSGTAHKRVNNKNCKMANWYSFMVFGCASFHIFMRSQIQTVDREYWLFNTFETLKVPQDVIFTVDRHIIILIEKIRKYVVFFRWYKEKFFEDYTQNWMCSRAHDDDSRGLFCDGSSRPAQLRLYLSSYRFKSFVNAVAMPSRYFPTF